MKQMDLTDIFRTFYFKTKGYTFFSAPHGKVSKTVHIIGQKTNINRYKNIEIVPCILSGHSGIRLIFNNKINNRKQTFTWKLNNTLLNSDKNYLFIHINITPFQPSKLCFCQAKSKKKYHFPLSTKKTPQNKLHDVFPILFPTLLYCRATTSFSPNTLEKKPSSIFQTISIRSSL